MNEKSISPAFLVVEDDPDDCFFLRMAAERSNLAASFEFFTTGPDLMDYLTHGEGIDCSSPAVDGYIILIDAFPAASSLFELVQTVRLAGNGCSDLPIYALLACEAEKDYLDFHDLNLSGYLIKPVVEADLSELINHLSLG